jgi:hypothetical protein
MRRLTQNAVGTISARLARMVRAAIKQEKKKVCRNQDWQSRRVGGKADGAARLLQREDKGAEERQDEIERTEHINEPRKPACTLRA